jgi:TRAP-type C4-dicarboxylate transport system permease small subunit
MKYLIEKAVQGMTTALACALIGMVGMICLGVALRYVWGVSLLWLDEALVFAMIAIVFLGAIGVSHRDQHLRMTLLSQSLPRGVAHKLGLLDQAVTAGVCLFVAWHSFHAIGRLYGRGTLSNMAEIPLWLVQGTVLAGLIGMAAVALSRLFAGLRLGDKQK